MIAHILRKCGSRHVKNSSVREEEGTHDITLNDFKLHAGVACTQKCTFLACP